MKDTLSRPKKQDLTSTSSNIEQGTFKKIATYCERHGNKWYNADGINLN